MIVLSVIYPCNFGCPNCPYTDGNSAIRQFYKNRNAELLPQELWNKIAIEAGQFGAWMRCTGGGEPMLHPKMAEMIEFAKEKGARVWLNTNGSMFRDTPLQRERLKRLLTAKIDLIEFSMDAADPDTYAKVRPPRGGYPTNPVKWFEDHVDNIRTALQWRKEFRVATRIVVSLIRQEALEGKLEEAIHFWTNHIGVDEVITRKFLTWDDNTNISFDHSMDPQLYQDQTDNKAPCVWPFERLNVDTLGRVSLCGQDISFRTASLFPSLFESSVQQVWQGEKFNWYRRMHLEGKGSQCWPCRGCSAWKAGIRDWDHGWLKVLKTSGDHLKDVLAKDLGNEVEIYQPLL